jgi:hypothetical protein
MRVRKRAFAVISASLFLVAGQLPSVAVAEDTGPWSIGIYEFPKCMVAHQEHKEWQVSQCAGRVQEEQRESHSIYLSECQQA